MGEIVAYKIELFHNSYMAYLKEQDEKGKMAHTYQGWLEVTLQTELRKDGRTHVKCPGMEGKCGTMRPLVVRECPNCLDPEFTL